jgi:nicotinamidase/pyrazinamidase
MVEEALEYPAGTALVVVDVQNDFADPAGSLYVRGAEDVVAAVNREVARAREQGAPVFYTRDWHPPSSPHFVDEGGIWPVHCVGDTWGAAFHPALVVAGQSVRKGSNGEDGYSGFTMRDTTSGFDVPTGLDDVLRQHRVTRVVVVGLALDYCVKATALDAVRLGYRCAVPATATAAVEVNAGDGAAAVAELVAAGVDVS